MTPIPFPLPAGRVLPPTVAYAAGLICEYRPDLAEGVRAAVLGDAALTALDVLTTARADAVDEQGATALGYLREIVHYAGLAPTALHGLADVLGLLIWSTVTCYNGQWNSATVWWQQTENGPWRLIRLCPDDVIFEPAPAPTYLFGHVPIGQAFWHECDKLRIAGLNRARFQDQAMAIRGSRAVQRYLREGFAVTWAASKSKGAQEALRRLIPIHAHTVSLDPTVRAAWAQAHLDALDVA